MLRQGLKTALFLNERSNKIRGLRAYFKSMGSFQPIVKSVFQEYRNKNARLGRALEQGLTFNKRLFCCVFLSSFAVVSATFMVALAMTAFTMASLVMFVSMHLAHGIAQRLLLFFG